jgi:putative ABC transport system permease protein
MSSGSFLSIGQLITAYVFVLLLLFISKTRKINKERIILLSSFRMTIQLVLVGYLLTYVFESPNWIFTVIILLFMQLFASYTVIRGIGKDISRKLKLILGSSLFLGSTVSLIYFVLVVLRVSPWYSPQEMIPIAGMLIGNSMTSISLGAKNLVDSFYSQRNTIENSLMLGAHPKDACKPYLNSAFESGIIPTLNSMLGMGIVFLPGMMTGQILAGINPVEAIKYQIAIMLGILGSVTLALTLFTEFGYTTFFNEYFQLDLRRDDRI